jgi:hypothetical protein
MRLATLSLALGMIALGAACGSSDEDPLAQRCAAACGNVAAPNPCANDTTKTKCLTECHKLATDAQTLHGKSCGECIADSPRYNPNPGCGSDPSCCWGITYGNPTADPCRTKCFEPDGSVGF